ncbi:MAG: DUF3180 domain-containing protein [Trueperella sp.]|nr:DUF3180 domain-containing protein [Trueperella sp.]
MLVAVAVIAGVTVFLLLHVWVSGGHAGIIIPRLVGLVPVGVGIFVLSQGWLVRSYTKGKRNISALYAARIWVLTQASSRAGAILAGAGLGVALAYWSLGDTGFLAEQTTAALLAAASCLFLTVCAWVAERWCITDPPDDADSAERTGQPA